MIYRYQGTETLRAGPRPDRKPELSNGNSGEGNKEGKHQIIGANYCTEAFLGKNIESAHPEKTQYNGWMSSIIMISSVLWA